MSDAGRYLLKCSGKESLFVKMFVLSDMSFEISFIAVDILGETQNADDVRI